MDDLAKSAFEKFESLLRTFIPGCIFLSALLISGEQSTLAGLIGDSDGRWALAAALVGVVLYGVHHAVLEDLFTKLAIRRIQRDKSRQLPKPYSDADPSDIIVWLSQERWSRPVAVDPRAQSHQRHLAKQYDWLIFLYCTAYALVASALAVFFWQSTARPGLVLLTVGAFFSWAALRADASVTRKEIWLNVEFPQHKR
jgi:hypothetical protein